MPTLTVAITYYGEGELLSRCVRSVLRQPGAPEEILVHDDASQVPAETFLDPKWPVRVIRADTNRGPSRGRNRLLDEAQGDFVHFHDADDWFDDRWCRAVREHLCAKLDAVFTEVASHAGARPLGDKIVGLTELANTDGDLIRFCLLHAMLVPSGTYRTAWLRRLGGYREELWQSEDYEFHCRLAAASPRFAVVPESLVHIEIRPESRSQKQGEVWSCRLDALRLIFLDLPPRYYPDISDAALAIGSKLFQLGERAKAREAFRFAGELGPPRTSSRMFAYRRIARWLGPEGAEWMGVLYRQLIPSGLRDWVRRRTG